MKRFLSLLLVLLLACSCAAFAESEDSSVSYVVLMDPVVSANDQALLDMTGLYLEFDTIANASALSVVVTVSAGEDYSVPVVAAQAQVDGDAVTLGMDGLSNMYKVPMSSLGMGDLSAAFVQSNVSTPEESLMALIDSLTVSSADGEYTLALSKEDSQKLLQPMIAALGAANSFGSTPVDLEGLGLEMEGTATVSDGSICLKLDGALSMEGEEETVPVSLDYDLTPESLDFVLSVDAGEDSQIAAAYSAELSSDEDGFYQRGYLSASATIEGASYGFDTYLNLGSYTVSDSSWMMDTSSALDVMSLDETQTNTLQMGAIGALGTAVTALQENVPGLAAVISSFASGLMS